MNSELKSTIVRKILPRVEKPAQYLGGEWNMVRKLPGEVTGRLCLAFPDVYSIGMSNHGLQVLYAVVNRLADWACERAFAPWPDFEKLLREYRLPLYSLETFTPLSAFDIVGFSLQHELCYTNVLTMLDLGGIPLRTVDRQLRDPLVIAGGPCTVNPEPMAEFVDVFVVGDGEEILPELCRLWLRLRESCPDRREALCQLGQLLPNCYVPIGYEVVYDSDGRALPPRPTCAGLPVVIRPAVVADLESVPLPTRPVVPNIECVQDRIAVEIMRGCPWRCRFCQSTTLKRPVRFRRVQTIVDAVVETYRHTGYNEVSLLSLSTSDYPHFEELYQRLKEALAPYRVSISVPSLRINEQLRLVGEILDTDRHSGLTLAPEAALDPMRARIGKNITNDDLIAGCRRAFERGFERVKLYFMCGLPGETAADLDGIIELAEAISRLRKELVGRPATVVANVSNLVPKPHTPFQWQGMARREYFVQAHRRLVSRKRMRTVELKYHDLETSLLEGLLSRGDRRLGPVIEWAWRQGCRLDSWTEYFRPEIWWDACRRFGVDVDLILHEPFPLERPLPWDHIAIRQGKAYLENEFRRSLILPAVCPSSAQDCEEVGPAAGGNSPRGD
ncbi:MAG: TIGR03960 family B12-binding radical SAM protein [Thermoguttaceae bacterium]|nr:TIGR03960 family B12-binding radical SAM protein [Thermoguttaceae bacterium]MDW8079352.1 TIGR03960 family B12-binding radical SAM protein [Thermoguttaceae bacterium]